MPLTRSELLNYLRPLNQVLSNPTLLAMADPSARDQLDSANRVIGRMLLEETVTDELKRKALDSFQALAGDIEDASADPELATAVARLQSLHSDTGAFDEALRLIRDIQRRLQSLGTPAVRPLLRRIMRIETALSEQIAAAFRAVVAPAAQPDAPADAVNVFTVDRDALTRFIAQTFPQETQVSVAECRAISGGTSKYTMGIRLNGAQSLPESVVMRADAGGMFGGSPVADEYRLLKILWDHGVCVPQPLVLEETGKVCGRPFMLVKKAPGLCIGHMFNLPPPNPVTCRDAGAKLARIHKVPIDQLGEGMRGARLKSSEQALSLLDESYAAWKTLYRPSAVYETAFHWLRENAHINDGARALVHGDYGLNNLLIDRDQISAILDWEFAHVGNPVYDLGYFYFQAESLASWEVFQRAYEEAGGVAPAQPQLDYSILFAATRLGVMVCQGEAAFRAGIVPGITIARVTSDYHEVSIMRLASVLERVL